MFKLNIKTDSGDISVSGIPTVELSGDLAQDKSVDSGIKLYDKDARTYTEWLVSYMDSKELAMLNGGSYRAEDCSAVLTGGSDRGEDCYYFKKGYNKLSTDIKFVKTINGVGPRESDGNIEFLGSKSADVYIPTGGEAAVIPKDSNGDNAITSEDAHVITSNVVALKRLTIANNNAELLYELYLLTMRLYHAYSYFARRILSFEQKLWNRQAQEPVSNLPDPSSATTEEEAKAYAEAVSTVMEHNLGRLQGTLLNYQANVARWNYLVWKSSYIQHAEASRQNLLLSLGFAATFCGPSAVKVVTTITCDATPDTTVSIPGTTVPTPDTTVPKMKAAAYLTIYRQSVSDDRQKRYDTNKVDRTPPVTTSIDKDGVKIDGYGIEQEYKNWEKITITQEIPDMVQSDSYSELFVLSPGMGILAYLSLPDNPNPETDFNEFTITTEWYIDNKEEPDFAETKTVKVLSVCAERPPDAE